MQVDLSKSEIELLNEALKEWERAPQRDGFGSALLGMMVGPKEEDGQKRSDAAKKVFTDANAESVARERRSLLLRAKLMQADAKESEHTIEA